MKVETRGVAWPLSIVNTAFNSINTSSDIISTDKNKRFLSGFSYGYSMVMRKFLKILLHPAALIYLSHT
jgi:thiamine pyrophosphokinase